MYARLGQPARNLAGGSMLRPAMRQIWISRAGGPDVLEVREAPDPVPGEGEVRIAVEAAGINFADLVARTAAMASTALSARL